MRNFLECIGGTEANKRAALGSPGEPPRVPGGLPSLKALTLNVAGEPGPAGAAALARALRGLDKSSGAEEIVVLCCEYSVP